MNIMFKLLNIVNQGKYLINNKINKLYKAHKLQNNLCKEY
jgi:hypothetical protein